MSILLSIICGMFGKTMSIPACNHIIRVIPNVLTNAIKGMLHRRVESGACSLQNLEIPSLFQSMYLTNQSWEHMSYMKENKIYQS